MGKVYSQEEIEHAEMLDEMFPDMAHMPYRSGGKDGQGEYVPTSGYLANKALEDRLASEGLRLVELSEEKILEMRVNNMLEAANTAGRNAEDIESMKKYLTSGISSGKIDLPTLRRGLGVSLSKDYQQQSDDLKLRQADDAEGRRLDTEVYTESDFSDLDESRERDRLESAVPHQ